MAQQGMISSPGSPAYPAVVVVGLPLAKQNATIVNTGLAVAGGVLLGLVVVGIGGMWLVRRNLRPLDRVAATATRVAHLPLSEGKVDIGARVPVQDTDTRTEVGQVGAAFNEMLDHVDHALNQRQKSEERVRQFVADASHELRTPLASIRGYAELTRREQEPVPQGVTYAIGRVESEAIRMTALVDDLLLLARLDAGRPLDHETVDLTEMVVNAVSDAHAASPDHVWQLDLPDEPVEVQGDPARLHQIVANLLGNARTHTAPGTVVRTSILPGNGQVRLAVARQRARGSEGAPARRLPAVRSWRHLTQPGCRQHRTRPVHRRGRRAGPWWVRLPRQRARRHHLHRPAPRLRAGIGPAAVAHTGGRLRPSRAVPSRCRNVSRSAAGVRWKCSSDMTSSSTTTSRSRPRP